MINLIELDLKKGCINKTKEPIYKSATTANLIQRMKKSLAYQSMSVNRSTILTLNTKTSSNNLLFTDCHYKLSYAHLKKRIIKETPK